MDATTGLVPLHLMAAAIVGLLCGAAIGFERQLRGHEAGLHTNALVAMGAAMFVAVSRDAGSDGAARMVAQIATGIGFLCAGLIWRDSGLVRGLNTAATIWCSAAVGLTAGLGYLAAAGALAILVLGANAILHVAGAKLGAERSGEEP